MFGVNQRDAHDADGSIGSHALRTLRNGELLNREWFRTRTGAKFFVERWRRFYNTQRPHSAHPYQPPVQVRRGWLETTAIDPRLTA